MAYFSSGYLLTKLGETLHAKVEAGAMLTLTKMQLGSGKTVSMADYYNRNSLLEPKNDVEIVTIAPDITGDKSICKLTGSLMNESVEEGYEARELGIFAKDTSGGEILYAVSYDEEPTYIPGKNAGSEIELNFDVYIAISSDTKVTIKQLTLPESMRDAMNQAAKSAAEAAAEARRAKDALAAMQTLSSAEVQEILEECGFTGGGTASGT